MDKNHGDFHAGELEPVPHPDTVRLNWLENETKMVGENGIKPDTWYTLNEYGDFVECE